MKKDPKPVGLLLQYDLSQEYLNPIFRFVLITPEWKPRHISDSDLEGHAHLANLVIRAQANGPRTLFGTREATTEEKAIRLYGWETHYHGPYGVDLSQAKRMCTTLTKLEAGLLRLEDKYGRPESFPAYVARVLDVLKVSTIIRETKHHGAFFDDNEYRVYQVSDLSWLIAEIQQAAKDKWGYLPQEEVSEATA